MYCGKFYLFQDAPLCTGGRDLAQSVAKFAHVHPRWLQNHIINIPLFFHIKTPFPPSPSPICSDFPPTSTCHRCTAPSPATTSRFVVAVSRLLPVTTANAPAALAGQSFQGKFLRFVFFRRAEISAAAAAAATAVVRWQRQSNGLPQDCVVPLVFAINRRPAAAAARRGIRPHIHLTLRSRPLFSCYARAPRLIHTVVTLALIMRF